MKADGKTDESINRASRSSLATFFPGYFAFVMATGIVSIANHLQGSEWIALALFGLNIVAYIVLWILTVLRFVRYRKPFLEDLTHHARGAGFLTYAAATCVLGSQFALLTPWMKVAEGLWVFGADLGLALSYTFLAALTICEPKPSLEKGISGAWLLIVVATQSVSVLGTLVAPSMDAMETVLFISLVTYFVGATLYVFFATLIVYRWLFFSMRPENLTPDYWINMGALAITTLAGALLIKAIPLWSLLQTVGPFLTGSALLFWAGATWWIPLLVTVQLWRHFRRRVPLKYGPDYWAMVFPLGMYAVATFRLASATGLTFLDGLAEFFTYAALIAWAIIFAGMLRSLTVLATKSGTD